MDNCPASAEQQAGPAVLGPLQVDIVRTRAHWGSACLQGLALSAFLCRTEVNVFEFMSLGDHPNG